MLYKQLREKPLSWCKPEWREEYQKWQNLHQSKTKPCGLCNNQSFQSTLIWIFFQTDRLHDQRSDRDLKAEIKELKDKNAERNYTPEFEETRRKLKRSDTAEKFNSYFDT